MSAEAVPVLRPDLRAIAELAPAGGRVLDLGCGDGALLAYLVRQKQITGRGVELSEAGVLACVRRGLSVRQGNLEEGLADYPQNSFDAVVLSQTLPFLDNTAMILREMLRVGRLGIVSFSNWGYWRARWGLLWHGRIPEAVDLPQAWYETPRWQAFTVADFETFCRQLDIPIRQRVFLRGPHKLQTGWWPNLRASTAVYVLGK